MNLEWKRNVQPICDDDWRRQFPHAPYPQRNPERPVRICCLCGRFTTSGITLQIDPETVPFPTEW